MKVLITTDTYYPMINGVVISTINLYKELKAKGHDVKIMTLSQANTERVEGDVYYLKSRKVNIYPDARFKVTIFGKLTRELLKWHPDIIHSQTEFSTMITAKYISRRLNIPHIHTYHTLYEDYLKYILNGKVIRKGTAARLTKLLLNSLDAVIVPTEKVESILVSYGVNVPKYIVPSGINVDKFKKNISIDEKRALKDRYGIGEQDKLLVYIGRIAEEKNIEEVIEFFSKLHIKNNSIKLMIVGGGPYLSKLRDKVAIESIEQAVIFTGMVPPKEVYKYYKLGDVFVTSSTSETQGLTYIEAMSSGCPVVCRWDECIKGLVLDGINGFTYTDSEKFCEGILKITQDDQLINNMAVNAEAKAQEYSCQAFGNKVLKVYYHVLNVKYLGMVI